VKTKIQVEAEPAGLSEADKEFLRADKERRQRQIGGENEIEGIQTSPEVVALLRRADAIERKHQELSVSGHELDEQLETFLPLDRRAGSIVENILSERTELRRLLGMTNHSHIHAYVERLSNERVRNFTIPAVAEVLKKEVDAFSEAVAGIPRRIKTLNESLAYYIQRLRNLNPGQAVGVPGAMEGYRVMEPDEGGDGITVVGNLKDHPKPSWD
jgi:hypothetical protein